MEWPQTVEISKLNRFPASHERRNMARKRFQVELPDGRSVWFTGDTISEAVSNGMKKYASAFVSDTPKASTLPSFAKYAEKWFPLYHVPKVKPNTANNTRIILHSPL